MSGAKGPGNLPGPFSLAVAPRTLLCVEQQPVTGSKIGRLECPNKSPKRLVLGLDLCKDDSHGNHPHHPAGNHSGRPIGPQQVRRTSGQRLVDLADPRPTEEHLGKVGESLLGHSDGLPDADDAHSRMLPASRRRSRGHESHRAGDLRHAQQVLTGSAAGSDERPRVPPPGAFLVLAVAQDLLRKS